MNRTFAGRKKTLWWRYRCEPKTKFTETKEL